MFALLLALSLGQNTQCWKQNGALKCASETQRPQRVQRASTRAQGRSGVVPPLAFFELGPVTGAGLGAACACTAVTGAKGEAVTWARAGSAYCTKEGAATTGLTNSSLVSCGSNLPRVEAGGNGQLGLRFERDTTNLTVRSQEMDNVAWSVIRSTVAFPVVTANFATAPDGTTTAERVEIAACPAVGNYSLVVQFRGATFNVNPATFGLYLKGTSGSGTIGLYADDGAVGNDYRTCSFNSTTWTRCSLTSTQGDLVQWGFGCLNIAAAPGSGDTGAADVLAWQGDLTNTAFATSPILSVAASTTRAVDAPPTIAGVTLTGLGSAGSSAVTVTPLGTGQASVAGVQIFNTAGRPMYFSTTVRMFDGTTELALAANHTEGVARRYWSSWTGATQTLTNVTDATNTTGAFDGAMDTTGPLQIGSDSVVGTISNYILSGLCLDPVATRCR